MGASPLEGFRPGRPDGIRAGSASDESRGRRRGPADQVQDDEKIGDAGVKPDQQLQDLIMGLLALVVLKGAGAQPAAAASTDMGEEKAGLDASPGSASEPSEAGASGAPRALSSSGPSNSESQTDNQSLLGALAVLLFSGLEAAIAWQGGRGAESAGQSGARAPNNGSTERQVASPAQLAGVSPGDRRQTASALSAGETQPLAARLFDAWKGEAATPSGPATAVRAEAGLTPAGENLLGDQSLTMRVFAGPVSAGQAGPERWTGSTMQYGGAAAANKAGDGRADAGSAIFADLTPLLESPDCDKPADEAAGRERSSDGQSWPVAIDASAPTTGGSAPQQQASSQPDPSGAIERFDRVMKQAGGATGIHDLTVRLTVGNEGRLVLGLKDLGSSVTVEVKASNQGMIDLLQSQRDVIISRLEGKDIYADLVIDPNASGTPEKRDKRETGQSMPGPRKQTDGGFRTFLETVV